MLNRAGVVKKLPGQLNRRKYAMLLAKCELL
jgi:hypothetical protein